jgi:hypothetical protein
MKIFSLKLQLEVETNKWLIWKMIIKLLTLFMLNIEHLVSIFLTMANNKLKDKVQHQTLQAKHCSINHLEMLLSIHMSKILSLQEIHKNLRKVMSNLKTNFKRMDDKVKEYRKTFNS